MRAFRTGFVAVLAVAGMAGTAQAQGFSLTLRGGAGFPLGEFAQSGSAPSERQILEGAKTGFGYGLDAALLLTRSIGVYAGFDRIVFDCEVEACGRDNRYTFAGLAAGVKLTPFHVGGLLPWIRGGVTFHELTGSYQQETGIGDLSSDRAPGYEVGVGVAVPILGLVAITPQVRYVGQSPRAKIRGIEYGEDAVERNVGYVTFDLGIGVLASRGTLGWQMRRR